jgi:hypothetical protein
MLCLVIEACRVSSEVAVNGALFTNSSCTEESLALATLPYSEVGPSATLVNLGFFGWGCSSSAPPDPGV